MRIKLDRGKYEVTFVKDTGELTIKKYGKPYRNLTGDDLMFHVFCLVSKLIISDLKLECLERAGVVDWENYQPAMREFKNIRQRVLRKEKRNENKIPK